MEGSGDKNFSLHKRDHRQSSASLSEAGRRTSGRYFWKSLFGPSLLLVACLCVNSMHDINRI